LNVPSVKEHAREVDVLLLMFWLLIGKIAISRRLEILILRRRGQTETSSWRNLKFRMAGDVKYDFYVFFSYSSESAVCHEDLKLVDAHATPVGTVRIPGMIPSGTVITVVIMNYHNAMMPSQSHKEHLDRDT
jgi:hypothetical protein